MRVWLIPQVLESSIVCHSRLSAPFFSWSTHTSSLHDFSCESFPRASKIHPILWLLPHPSGFSSPTDFFPLLLKSVGMSLKVSRCRSIIYFGKFIFRNSVAVFSLVSFSENNCFSPPSFIFWTLYNIKYAYMFVCTVPTVYSRRQMTTY